MKKINKLEKQPNSLSIIYSMSTGVLGALFLFFGFLSMTNNLYIFFILNVLIGTIGIIFPYFIYTKYEKEIKEKNKILIEEEYDIIYNCCEKASNLIN